MSNSRYPPGTSPFAIMYDHGLHEYIPEAREILADPDRWETRYGTEPLALAMGLTYYVAFQDYTPSEVATIYGGSKHELRRAYKKLRDDYGPPE